MRDNILIEKIWQEQENDLVELKINCSAEYASAIQTCYVQKEALGYICDQITKCVNLLQKEHSYSKKDDIKEAQIIDKKEL